MPLVLEECREAEHVTNANFMDLINPNKPKSKEMKCLITCVAEKFGQVVNLNTKFLHKKSIDQILIKQIVNSKFNPVAMMDWVRSLPIYTGELEKIFSGILQDCKDVKDPDR